MGHLNKYRNIFLLVHANLSSLRGYRNRGSAHTDIRRSSDGDLAYLGWVSRLKCPYYNCRKEGFQSMESYSGHVSNHAQFLEASYWCPFCDQVEHLGVEELGDGSFAINPSNKGSKMKRAGEFIKRLRCPGCKNPLKTLYRRHVRNRNAAELESSIAYPHGKFELEFNQEPPLYPESPDSVGRYELEPSSGRKSISRSSTGSAFSERNPTREEVKDFHSTHLDAPNPNAVTKRAKTSSYCSVNSQRKSKIGLRLSTHDRRSENGSVLYSPEQFRVSNAGMSESSINHSIQTGSSLVESSGSSPLESRFSITARQAPPDDGTISPLSPDSSQPGGQIKQGLSSAVTACSPLEPDHGQEVRVKQRPGTIFLPSDDEIDARNAAEQRTPNIVPGSTRKQSSNWDSLPPIDSSYLSYQDLQKGSHQYGNKDAPNQSCTIVHRKPLSTSQVTPATAVAGSLRRSLHETLLI